MRKRAIAFTPTTAIANAYGAAAAHPAPGSPLHLAPAQRVRIR